MSENAPALAIRYYLNLEESQDGFKLATLGKKQLTRFLTPIVSIAILLWGFYLGFDGVGGYYIMLGGFFLLLQIAMRYWFLPFMFKRQYVKYQFGKSEQGTELFQHYALLFTSGRPKKKFEYTEVKRFLVGKLTYMVELKNSTVVIIPKRAFATEVEQNIFENTFKAQH